MSPWWCMGMLNEVCRKTTLGTGGERSWADVPRANLLFRTFSKMEGHISRATSVDLATGVRKLAEVSSIQHICGCVCSLVDWSLW